MAIVTLQPSSLEIPQKVGKVNLTIAQVNVVIDTVEDGERHEWYNSELLGRSLNMVKEKIERRLSGRERLDCKKPL